MWERQENSEAGPLVQENSQTFLTSATNVADYREVVYGQLHQVCGRRHDGARSVLKANFEMQNTERAEMSCG